MRFLLDHNVPASVAAVLQDNGHDVALLTDLLPQDSPDPLVAKTAIIEDRVLVSHDRDMRRIERLISDGFRERFPQLKRMHLSCSEVVSANRVQAFIHLIEAEAVYVEQLGLPLLLEIGDRRARVIR